MRIISIALCWEKSGGSDWDRKEGCLGAGRTQCPDPWVDVTWVNSYCEDVLSCTLMICKLLSRCDRL